MVKTDTDLLQCPACHVYVEPNDLICTECSAILPKGQEAKSKARARILEREPGEEQAAYERRKAERERAEALVAYERKKQELSHVPRWLLRLSAAVDHANDNPRVHRLVQWFGGLVGFQLAFQLTGPLLSIVPTPLPLPAWLILTLKILMGALAFWLTSHFIFTIFTNIVVGLRQVFGEHQENHILQGTAKEKARLYKNRQ